MFQGAGLAFSVGGVGRWVFNANGHAYPATDNTYDIGVAGSAYHRAIYAYTLQAFAQVQTPGWTNGTNLLANTDNTVDIGASAANRPRNIWVANLVTVPNVQAAGGTAAFPAYSFAGEVNTGVYKRATGAVDVTLQGNNALDIQYNPGVSRSYVGMGALMALGWASTNDPGASVPDLTLVREATGVLAQRGGTPGVGHGTDAQTFRLYNTYTDASNYERVTLTWSANSAYLQTENAGTGVARNLRLVAGADMVISPGGVLYLQSQFVNRWIINTGHLTAVADNTYDIGASGASRPRNVYVANGVICRDYSGAANKFSLTESTGGRLRMTKATAIEANPGADSAFLYFRDGTTVGTLKLVARAGAAGAETTILDNIPQ
jgi:hypothetical protein